MADGVDERIGWLRWAVAMAALILPALPAGAAAQLRRDPPVQPLGEERAGAVLLGLGSGLEVDRRFPLSGLRGDLFTPAALTLLWAPASGVLLEVRGDVWRILAVRDRGPGHVPLDPDVSDGTTADVGDFRIGLWARVLGGREGLAAGLRAEVTLPNSDESLGIGTNTTDVRLGIVGGYGRDAWRATGEIGVAILQAPLETFVQNDVVVYAGELLRDLGRRARLFLGFEGRAATRGHVPVGTEDRGEVVAGVEIERSGWRVDAGVSAGYAGTAGDWGVALGVARSMGGRGR